MAFTKQTTSIADNITERGQIHVKTITRVLEDGNLLSESVHRKVLSPGDSLSGEAAQVAAIAAAVWTPEIVAAWQAGNPAPAVDWRPEAMADLNVMRAKIMNVLTAMQTDYTARGEAASAAACLDAKAAVKVIDKATGVVTAYTDTNGTREAFDLAVKARWAEIVTPAPLQVKSDFNKYGGNTV